MVKHGGPCQGPGQTDGTICGTTEIGDKSSWRVGGRFKPEHKGKLCCTKTKCRKFLGVIADVAPSAAAATAAPASVPEPAGGAAAAAPIAEAARSARAAAAAVAHPFVCACYRYARCGRISGGGDSVLSGGGDHWLEQRARCSCRAGASRAGLLRGACPMLLRWSKQRPVPLRWRTCSRSW